MALSNLGEVATRRGMWPAAAARFAEALTLSWRHGDRWTLPSCLECLAEVALFGYGRAEQAVRLFEAATAVRAAAGFPPQAQEEAKRERIIARARVRLGGAALDAARGAGPRTGGGAGRGRSAQGGGGAVPALSDLEAHGLTPRERDVLRLLAEGHPDRQIAAILSISPKTAENHVARILAKLGVEGRTAAATLAIRRGLA